MPYTTSACVRSLRSVHRLPSPSVASRSSGPRSCRCWPPRCAASPARAAPPAWPAAAWAPLGGEVETYVEWAGWWDGICSWAADPYPRPLPHSQQILGPTSGPPQSLRPDPSQRLRTASPAPDRPTSLATCRALGRGAGRGEGSKDSARTRGPQNHEKPRFSHTKNQVVFAIGKTWICMVCGAPGSY